MSAIPDTAILRPAFAADLLAYGLGRDPTHVALRAEETRRCDDPGSQGVAGATSRYALALRGAGSASRHTCRNPCTQPS